MARGGGYGPGAPKHTAWTTYGLDYVVPTLEAVLGREDMLGLDVTTVIPELTMVPHAPALALAALLPRHEESMASAHHCARELATTIADGTTAA